MIQLKEFRHSVEKVNEYLRDNKKNIEFVDIKIDTRISYTMGTQKTINSTTVVYTLIYKLVK